MKNAHPADEPVARIGITRILEKVTAMESMLAVQACAIQAYGEDLRELSGRMAAMESTRIPWGRLATIAGVISATVAVIAIFIKSN